MTPKNFWNAISQAEDCNNFLTRLEEHEKFYKNEVAS